MAKFSMTKQKYINQWLRHFAPNLSKDQFEKYIRDQYIWHVFSWELIEFDGLLVGNDARQAFDQAIKNDCIYVVAKDYSWTYIKTHEGDSCGPYFLRKA